MTLAFVLTLLSIALTIINGLALYSIREFIINHNAEIAYIKLKQENIELAYKELEASNA